MNHGRSVFSQLLQLLPRRAFDLAIERYRGQSRVRQFSCMDQLLCMIFAQLTGRSSLRETVTCLRALGSRRYHCGIRAEPAKSTLAAANEQRDYRAQVDRRRVDRKGAKIQSPQVRVDRQLHLRRGDHRQKLFPWALFRKRKGAVKAHTMLDLRVGIPVFMRVSHAKTHDVQVLDQIIPQAGAFYVMDKGYIDFARLHRFHQASSFFITRAKSNMEYRVRSRRPVIPGGPVTHDQLIRLVGPKSRGKFPDTLRRIRYIDPETGKRLTFLTNNLMLDALIIALLYRKRWQIELFFKWIKQHLHIKAFFGTTPNAVQTQLWIAVIVYVLIHRLKHLYSLRQTLNEIFQVLGVTLLEKLPVNQVFSELSQEIQETMDCNQLSLFEF